MDLFFDVNRSDVIIETSGPKFDAINTSIKELTTEVKNTTDAVQSQSSSLQNLQQAITSVSGDLATKADNSELQGLKDVVAQLHKDVSVNTQIKKQDRSAGTHSKAEVEAAAAVDTANVVIPTSTTPDTVASPVDDDKEEEMNFEEPSQAEGEQDDAN
ncbi:hypothetical protein L6452_38967 [Arctium lappa]|uniref:Uncharacterized protein n=1 Tax=Arctium lappa TaxID=4217 RepID=A0ACB8XRG5_ARCLA|nr:hypothetical protein L6452_38967 [Arctium lappa]